MRPEWTDAEKGEAAGIAHRAAWATVCPEPPEGWRNSYDVRYDPELAAAHTAAHQAMDDYPTRDFDCDLGRAYNDAWWGIKDWADSGRYISGYEAHVPRLSEASVDHPSPGDNPRQRP